MTFWSAGTSSVANPGRDTTTLNDPVLVWPRPSVAEHDTVAVPILNSEPDAGRHTGVPLLEVGAGYATVAPSGDTANAARSPEMLNTGAAGSDTVTVNALVTALSWGSRATHETVVMPVGKVPPESVPALQTTDNVVAASSGSEADMAVGYTTGVLLSAVATTEMERGTTSSGGVVSKVVRDTV